MDPSCAIFLDPSVMSHTGVRRMGCTKGGVLPAGRLLPIPIQCDGLLGSSVSWTTGVVIYPCYHLCFELFTMFSGASNLVFTGGNFSFNEPRNATQGTYSHLNMMTS